MVFYLLGVFGFGIHVGSRNKVFNVVYKIIRLQIDLLTRFLKLNSVSLSAFGFAANGHFALFYAFLCFEFVSEGLLAACATVIGVGVLVY